MIFKKVTGVTTKSSSSTVVTNPELKAGIWERHTDVFSSTGNVLSWEESGFLFSKFHNYCNDPKTCGKLHPLMLSVALGSSLLIRDLLYGFGKQCCSPVAYTVNSFIPFWTGYFCTVTCNCKADLIHGLPFQSNGLNCFLKGKSRNLNLHCQQQYTKH